MSGSPIRWSSCRLDEVCTMITDGTHHSPPNSQVGEYKYITAKNIRAGGLDLDNITYVDADVHKSIHARAPVEPNDVLYTKDGAKTGVAAVNTLDEPFSTLSSVALLKANRELIDPHFLACWLNSPETFNRMTNQMTGSAIRRLTLTIICRQQIELPPLPEQRRIVAKLDSLFARTKIARGELARIPLLVEHYKQAVLKKAFSGQLTADWRGRGVANPSISPRGSAAMKKKYRLAGEASFSPPYDVPADWRWLRMPELGDLDRGKSKHRPRNDPTLYGGDFPFVQTGEVREAERYLQSYSKTYNERGLAQSRLWPVGTVCITIAANIAETAILDIEACFPDSVVGFIPDEERISSSYIEFFLRTMKEDLEAFAPATAQKNINLDTLSTVYVPVPPLAEQAEIVRRIEASMDWLSVVASEQVMAGHLLDHLDQGLLAKAFRGELVPQDPSDEPAEQLLARIRADRGAQGQPKRGRRKKEVIDA